MSKTVGFSGCTIYDAARNNGFKTFAVMHKGDFSSMRSEQDIIVNDKSNSKEKMEYKGMKNVRVGFPVIEDLKMEVARKYGMIQPNASTTQAVRATFVIDPHAKIRAILYYPQSTGRNMDEIKRMIIALQKTDKEHIATPASWNPGEDVIIPPAGDYDTAEQRVESKEEGMYCLDWFICFKKESDK